MKPFFNMLLLGVTALLIFAVYSTVDVTIQSNGAEIKKADFISLYNLDEDAEQPPVKITVKDTLEETISKPVVKPDTAQNILFIGDSMLEGLCKRFIDYTEQNRHKLHTVIWYSSNSDLWGNTDTLAYFMRKFNPSYIVVCLGSNELFVKDIKKRKVNIENIIKKIGDLPYVWISPPNWKNDTGINEAILSVVGPGKYFDSRHLVLDRKQDHAHPTDAAAIVWMDTIARWMSSEACDNPLQMDWPGKDFKMKNVTVLKPVKR